MWILKSKSPSRNKEVIMKLKIYENVNEHSKGGCKTGWILAWIPVYVDIHSKIILFEK